MSIHLLVTADFPNMTDEQRSTIYKRLESREWQKILIVELDNSTVWHARFDENATYPGAVETALEDFSECSVPYAIPRLALQAGPNEPTTY